MFDAMSLRPTGRSGAAILSVRATRNDRLPRWTALVSVFLLLGTVAIAESESDTARAILERAAKRQGGGKLAVKGAIKDFYVHLAIPRYEPGDGTRADGEAKHWYMPPTPDRKRPLMKKWWKGSGNPITSALTFTHTTRREYESAWTAQGRQVTRLVITKEKDRKSILKLRREAKDIDLLLRTFLLQNLLGKEAKLTTLKPVVRNDRKILRVLRTAPGDPVFILWIDAKTHDLAGVRLPANAAGQIEQTFSFSGQREFQAVRVPFKIEIRERSFEDAKAGKEARLTTEAFVKDLKLNQGLTEKDFSPP